MPSDDAAQRDAVVELVRDVLGDALLGMFLHGSAVLGGLRPLSDVDLLAVSARRTSPEERRRLVDALLVLSGPPSRPVELVIVAQPDMRPWRFPPRADLAYGEWLRPELERGDVEPQGRTDPDLASLLTMVLLASRPLLGPPPSDVLDPVPRSDYVRAIVGGIDGVLAHLDLYTRNGVLELARIWCTLTTGVICAKDRAADWALARLPAEHRGVLRHARAVYLGDESEDWSELAPRVRPHADWVIARIEGLADEGATDPPQLRLER